MARLTDERGVLGFSALEVSEFKAWLESELRLAQRARERGEVPESVYERIFLLLALGESPNEHEARAARLKAVALMERYEIDREELNAWRSRR